MISHIPRWSGQAFLKERIALLKTPLSGVFQWLTAELAKKLRSCGDFFAFTGSSRTNAIAGVALLQARGYSNQQIADSLYLSVKTIETYRSRIGEKLGLRNRAEMVALAIKAGLLETTELS